MTHVRMRRARRLGVATLGCSMVLTGGSMALLAPTAGATQTQTPKTPSVTLTKEAGFPANKDAKTGGFDSREGTDPIVGQTVIYRLKLTRKDTPNGTVETTTDQLPAGVEFVAGSFDGLASGESATYDAGTNSITWTTKKASGSDDEDALTYKVVVKQAGALTNTATTASPSATASVTLNGTAITPNPDLQLACPTAYDVTLVLDASGSIDDPGKAVAKVRDAANKFLVALQGTGSRANVVQFGTSSRTLLSPMTEITTATLANGGAHYDALYGNNGYYNPGGGYTNWEAGLSAANDILSTGDDNPDLVVFVTDGVPNNYLPVQSTEDSEARRSVARNQAVAVSNALKAEGVKLIGVGVGQIANSPAGSDALWTRNLLAVTGDSFETTGAPNNLITDPAALTDDKVAGLDAVVFDDFDKLGTALANIASGLCGEPGIGVDKTVDKDVLVAGQGFATFTVTVTNPATLPLQLALTDVLTDTDLSTSAITLAGPTGDTNTNGLLDKGESWTYTSQYSASTTPGDVTNNVSVTGTATGYPTVSGSDSASLKVVPPAPEQATITIVKETTEGTGTFSFQVTEGDNDPTQVDLVVEDTSASTELTVDPGTFTVEELAQPGWTLTASACRFPEDERSAKTVETPQSLLEFSLEDGDEITCTFTNSPVSPGLTIDKRLSRTFDDSEPGKDFFKAFGYTVGDTAVYQYKVVNTGNVAMTNIVLTDQLLYGVSPSQQTNRPGVPTTADLTACRVDNNLGATPVSDRAVVDPYVFGQAAQIGGQPVTLAPEESLYIYCYLPITADFTPLPAGAPTEAIFNRATVTGEFQSDGTKTLGPITSEWTKISFTDVVKNLVTINSTNGSYDFATTNVLDWGSTATFRMVVNNSLGVTLTNVRLYDYFSASNLATPGAQDALFDTMKCIDHDDVGDLRTALGRNEFFTDDEQGDLAPQNAENRAFPKAGGGTEVFYARERLLDSEPYTRGDGTPITSPFVGDTVIDDLAPGDGFAVLCTLKLPDVPLPVTTGPLGTKLALTNTFRVLAVDPSKLEDSRIQPLGALGDSRLFSAAPLFRQAPADPGFANVDLQASTSLNTEPSCAQTNTCPPPPCTVNCTPPPPCTVNCSTPTYDLGVTKTVGSSVVTVGSSVTYTITVTAAVTSGNLTNVVVTDELPAELEKPVVTAPNGWTCTVTGQKVECTKPTFAFDEKAAIKIAASLKSTVTGGTQVKNVVTVKATETETTLANNTSTAGLQVVAAALPAVPVVTLPATGGSLRLAGLALLLLGLGAIAIAFGRRRETTT